MSMLYCEYVETKEKTRMQAYLTLLQILRTIALRMNAVCTQEYNTL